jgi:hypothetical protein
MLVTLLTSHPLMSWLKAEAIFNIQDTFVAPDEIDEGLTLTKLLANLNGALQPVMPRAPKRFNLNQLVVITRTIVSKCSYRSRYLYLLPNTVHHLPYSHAPTITIYSALVVAYISIRREVKKIV